jgi:hypothetical protein
MWKMWYDHSDVISVIMDISLAQGSPDVLEKV